MDRLDVTVFGRPSICWQGKRVSFPFSKMEALLYYLLIQGQTTREKLAGLLWSDMDDVTAKKNLRNTLYLLKKMIADEVVLTPNRSVIKSNPSIVNIIDLQHFNENTANALNAYRGDFLDGFSCKEAGLFEDWVIEQRERFRESYALRLTKHIIDLIKDKKYSDAKHFLKRLIDVDEYNESAYRALMRIYEREGCFSKVFETYLKLEKKVASELGISPDVKTKEIYDRVQKRNIASPVIYQSLSEDCFFGRVKELNRLIRLAEDFRAGRNIKQLVVLHGEQGVGKSTLMKRFIETAPPDKGVLALRTHCYEPEANYPYKAWSNIFCQVMKVMLEEGKTIPVLWRQVIAYMFPSAIPSADWEELNTSFAAQIMRPGVLGEVLQGILGKLVKTRKIGICIEDVHWMDMQGLTELKGILRLYGSQVMCVATCRSEHVERFKRMMGDLSDIATEWLAVDRFNREDVIRFSALVLPPDKIKPAVQQQLYEYTEGNALFLVECFKLIQMGQDIGNLSPKLQSVLTARMIAFSLNSKKVLKAASIFFCEATYDALASVCGLNELELVEAIEEILQNQVMIEIDSAERGLSYKFSHALIRDYIYSKLSSSFQKLMHHRIGIYLEQQMAADCKARDLYSALLYHYSRAKERHKVLEYTIKIAERFSCPHYEMFPEINDYYQTGNHSITAERLQLTDYLQQISELLQSLQEEIAGETELSRYKAAYLEMLGRCHIWRGEHRKGLKVIHKLLRLARSNEYSDYLIKGYQQVVYCGIQTRNDKLIEVFAYKLLKTANELKLKEKMAAALRFLGLAHAMRKDNVTSERHYRQSIALFRRLPNNPRKYAANIGAAYNYIGDIRRAENNLPEALQYYEKAVTLYSQHHVGGGEALSIIYVNAGYIAFELGDSEKARKYLAAALRVSKQFGGQMGYWCLRSHCTLNGTLALIRVQEGKPAAGLKYLKRADRFLARYSDLYQTGVVLRVKTELRAKMDCDIRTQKVFAAYLPLSALEYYQSSKEIFSKLDDEFQLRTLDELVRRKLSINTLPEDSAPAEEKSGTPAYRSRSPEGYQIL